MSKAGPDSLSAKVGIGRGVLYAVPTPKLEIVCQATNRVASPLAEKLNLLTGGAVKTLSARRRIDQIFGGDKPSGHE